ncbi:MAG: ABC transporter permease [Firmicutes bacterium]|nr:ABC transporter permease [Bacillota bacterium]MBQ6685397.1 ABC transporter permease [Bacillota bacterium]
MYVTALVLVLGPLLYMVYLSFMSRGEVWGFVNEATLENYKQLLDPLYMDTFLASLKLAMLSTGLIILMGYPFGYFMARLSEEWKRRMMLLIMLPFWTSSLIRLYGWIIVFRSNGTLDQLLMFFGVIDRPLKLLYTYPAVVVGMIYALLPFMILSVYSSAEKMDWRLVDAARDLGASRWKAFTSVTLPLTMPGLLSGIILTFIPSMGLFFIADILGGNKIVLVGSMIQELMTRGRNLPLAAAMAVVLMLMTSALLWLYRKISRTSKLEGLV